MSHALQARFYRYDKRLERELKSRIVDHLLRLTPEDRHMRFFAALNWERVESLDRRAEKMEQQLEALLELANKSKGGLWFGMTVVSMLSAVVGFVASHWKGAP